MDKKSDKNAKSSLQTRLDAITRRVNQPCDISDQDKLLEMVTRIRDPMIVLPKDIDKQHFLKGCPNAVVDLRRGEPHPGKPEQYLLNSIATEYDPSLLSCENPCPEVNRYLLRSMDEVQELVDFIWRLPGYGLVTERKDHVPGM